MPHCTSPHWECTKARDGLSAGTLLCGACNTSPWEWRLPSYPEARRALGTQRDPRCVQPPTALSSPPRCLQTRRPAPGTTRPLQPRSCLAHPRASPASHPRPQAARAAPGPPAGLLRSRGREGAQSTSEKRSPSSLSRSRKQVHCQRELK